MIKRRAPPPGTEFVIEAWDADLHGHNEFLGECEVAHEESVAHTAKESEGTDHADDDHEEGHHHDPRAGVWIKTVELKPQVSQCHTLLLFSIDKHCFAVPISVYIVNRYCCYYEDFIR